MDIEEALADETVPDLTKKMIRCVINGEGFGLVPYESKTPGRNLYSILATESDRGSESENT